MESEGALARRMSLGIKYDIHYRHTKVSEEKSQMSWYNSVAVLNVVLFSVPFKYICRPLVGDASFGIDSLRATQDRFGVRLP